MKVSVDFDRCRSSAACMRVCPEVFEVRADGYLYVLDENPPDSLRDAVEQAVASCPTGAVGVEE